jgi:hypothetical protein
VKRLLRAAGCVESDGDDDKHDAEHSYGSDQFHQLWLLELCNASFDPAMENHYTSAKQHQPHNGEKHGVRRSRVGRGDEPTGEAG